VKAGYNPDFDFLDHQDARNKMEGSRKIKSTTEYLDSGLGLKATMRLKTIKLSNEISPPIPGFHMANTSPASPTPHIANVIIKLVGKSGAGLFRPSSKDPIKKNKTNATINIPIMLDVKCKALKDVDFFIFINFCVLI
jgi:hypothetical protein